MQSPCALEQRPTSIGSSIIHITRSSNFATKSTSQQAHCSLFARFFVTHNHINPKKMSFIQFVRQWYAVLLAFVCLLYSVSLGLLGHTDEALYSAHWAGTILLFSIAIRQRRPRKA
jgi:hypothetical protein